MIIFLIIGIIIGSSIGVYALDKLNSNIVLYNNDITNVNNVKEALDELFLRTPKNLSDVVSIGDYVAYDAGTWTSSAAKPTSQGNFGGYTAGENRANSVNWCYNSSDENVTLKGWRVLNVDKITNVVTIVHAGHPECYYHYNDQSGSITALNNRASNTYLNSTYATSAHAMNYDEALPITESTEYTDNNLRNIGSRYWLASSYNYNNTLWSGGPDGSLGPCLTTNGSSSFGVRPIVVLKSGIKTAGKTIDEVGNEAWSLVAP